MSEPFVGEIRMFAGDFAPRGWAFCDGQLIAVSSNDALFSLLGTIYGGDGRTTFGLPDLRGRTPIHYGSGPGLTPRSIGSSGGQEGVGLVPNNLPAHNHTGVQAANDTANAAAAADNELANASSPVYVPGGAAAMKADSVSATGGGQEHNNMMQFNTINYIISLFGVYPSRN
jgi:microcystin-dependent protein